MNAKLFFNLSVALGIVIPRGEWKAWDLVFHIVVEWWRKCFMDLSTWTVAQRTRRTHVHSTVTIGLLRFACGSRSAPMKQEIEQCLTYCSLMTLFAKARTSYFFFSCVAHLDHLAVKW